MPNHVAPESMLGENVARIAELGLALVESLLHEVIGTSADTSEKGAVRNLTICGMTLVTQHARGAIAELAAGRPYSAIALDRCMYEAMVRVMQWQTDPPRALLEWRAIPWFATREEKKRSGGHAHMPPGVIRDIAKYLADNPDIESVQTTRDFERQARALFGSEFGLSAKQLSDDICCHVDMPSLYVHCRPLVAEDMYDGSDPDHMLLRPASRTIEPEGTALEIVRLLTLFATFVARRTGFEVKPSERVQAQWYEALTEYKRRIAGTDTSS
jgi:hypothetical protein